MKIDVFDMVKIKTPIGEARLENMVWTSENKDLETVLNEDFGKDSDLIRHEHVVFGVAHFILADQAVRKYGGEITEIKKHRKIISDEVD